MAFDRVVRAPGEFLLVVIQAIRNSVKEGSFSFSFEEVPLF
jgi:hypothetical protein